MVQCTLAYLQRWQSILALQQRVSDRRVSRFAFRVSRLEFGGSKPGGRKPQHFLLQWQKRPITIAKKAYKHSKRGLLQ